MNITLRNLPEELASKLKQMAKRARRSLNNEILHRLELSVKHETGESNLPLSEQKKKILKLAGSWRDDRSTQEIVDDIYRSRTPGRNVEL